jgi:hypothetical protein
VPGAEPTSTAVTEWQGQGVAIVGDALATLRTFDNFAAYRASLSGSKTANSLVWDPPTSVAWDAATHVSRGLHDRANQLFQAITTASIDPALWRTQRGLADATRDLIQVGDALRAYRDRLDRLPPGDASGANELLDRAWGLWDAAAPRWGLARTEAVNCQG